MTPTHRRTLSGKRVPVDTPRRTWQDIVRVPAQPKPETDAA